MTDIESVLIKSGVPIHLRRKMLNSLVASADQDKPNEDSLPQASRIAATLQAAGFSSDATDKIVTALVRDGHAHGDIAINASAANLSPLQKQALAICHRIGVPVSNGVVSIHKLDEVMASKSMSIEDRFCTKVALRQAGLLDA
jgi:hypothetical protein